MNRGFLCSLVFVTMFHQEPMIFPVNTIKDVVSTIKLTKLFDQQ